MHGPIEMQVVAGPAIRLHLGQGGGGAGEVGLPGALEDARGLGGNAGHGRAQSQPVRPGLGEPGDEIASRISKPVMILSGLPEAERVNPVPNVIHC